MSNQIDILMATYNGAKYLPEQLDSLLNQTHKNFRLLIRDDLSTDQTPSIISEYAKKHPDKIVVFPSDIRLGVIGNFSTLLQKTPADYIMFCDQDDVWLPQKIEKSLHCLKRLETEKGKNIPILIHTDLKIVDQELKSICESFWKYSNLDPWKGKQLNRLLLENSFTGCTMLFNRALLNFALPIPQETGMYDWWIALTASALGIIKTIEEPTILYRQHSSNAVSALKFSFVEFCMRWKHIYRCRHQYKQERLDQASVFYDRFEPLLNKQQKKLIHTLLHLHEKNFFKKRYQMLSQGFLRPGFLQNFATLLLGI